MNIIRKMVGSNVKYVQIVKEKKGETHIRFNGEKENTAFAAAVTIVLIWLLVVNTGIK